jgi:hypothetical protein
MMVRSRQWFNQPWSISPRARGLDLLDGEPDWAAIAFSSSGPTFMTIMPVLSSHDVRRVLAGHRIYPAAACAPCVEPRRARLRRSPGPLHQGSPHPSARRCHHLRQPMSPQARQMAIDAAPSKAEQPRQITNRSREGRVDRPRLRPEPASPPEIMNLPSPPRSSDAPRTFILFR